MDPDQTAPTGSTLFEQDASKTFQQRTKADDFVVIGAKYLGLTIWKGYEMTLVTTSNMYGKILTF